MPVFLKSIYVSQCRNLTDFKIPISESSRLHLILTGRNGSGKTSLLNEINKFLLGLFNGSISNLNAYRTLMQSSSEAIRLPGLNEQEKLKHRNNFETIRSWIEQNFGSCELDFSDEIELEQKLKEGTFLLAYFGAKRIAQVQAPSGINIVQLPLRSSPNSHDNAKFLQYIVNLKADRSFARDDGKLEEASKIDEWFLHFTEQLRTIFGASELRLEFNRSNYSFDIVIPGLKPFGFNELSDGYSAFLSIVTELLLRMEAHGNQRKAYDMEGVVLIDEIETHLHVDLQKKILPFLTAVFPDIQFVISTHSPFVLSSIGNAVVCDLENRFITEDLSGYSYDALIESYFNSDKYSYELKRMLAEYEELISESKPSDEHQNRLLDLERYFDAVPKQFGPELAVRLQQIQLARLNGAK